MAPEHTSATKIKDLSSDAVKQIINASIASIQRRLKEKTPDGAVTPTSAEHG